ncbi:MAG: transcriptional regulator [Gammaproteobacteria bacterium]|nr:transcriptional regulator [Gammaproteobacteria bacterium]
MKPKIINHHYTECGLPNVWIKCRCVKDNAGKDTIIIPNIGLLHKAIARDIILSDGALSGAEIKFLRSMMGLTPAEFGKLIHREAATVSRWEHGGAAPDGAMDTLIRMLATAKLKLKADPAEISGKYAPAAARKAAIRIKIKMTGHRQYQLAA